MMCNQPQWTQWYATNLSEPQWYAINFSEPQWYAINLSEPLWYAINLSKSQWYVINLSEPQWYGINLSKPKWYVHRSSVKPLRCHFEQQWYNNTVYPNDDTILNYNDIKYPSVNYNDTQCTTIVVNYIDKRWYSVNQNQELQWIRWYNLPQW